MVGSSQFWGQFLHACAFCSLTEMCSFWHYLKDLFPLHKYKMVNLYLTIKTEDITKGTAIMDPHCQLWMVQEQMG